MMGRLLTLEDKAGQLALKTRKGIELTRHSEMHRQCLQATNAINELWCKVHKIP